MLILINCEKKFDIYEYSMHSAVDYASQIYKTKRCGIIKFFCAKYPSARNAIHNMLKDPAEKLEP